MKPSGLSSAIFSAVVPAAFGAVGIRTENDQLKELVYLPREFSAKAPANALAEQAANQVERYLADPDYRFSLPLCEVGSIFQRRVWSAISGIPRGTVKTYGDIARMISSAPRAVGQACGANWYPLVIPCHRVTAINGLGGFACTDTPDAFHLGVKRWLLSHEGVDRFSVT